ncbi:RPA-related protein RADX-like [Littorina saxatilis]|uniref:Uncharacterized protein n=1 Tax=Littorina saxatilis TaxID=31220 RepID=A0AAN9BCE5_9CAEN
MSDSESLFSVENDLEQSVLTVVDVERYVIDPVFLQQTGLSGPHAFDAYDITVANNQHRRKVVMSYELNHLVQKRKIRAGTCVRLNKVNMRYDETALDGRGIPVVHELTVIEQRDEKDIDDLSTLPWYPKDGIHQAPQPLASCRGYYVDIWSSAEVAKTVDDFQVQVSDSLGTVDSQDLFSLQEVANRWQSVKSARPRLLLRVMRRSKLFHYARPNVKAKWPFQLQTVVGDETGCCVAVFWNILAPRYLHYIQEGTVLLLRNFIIKPRFQIPEHPVPRPPDLPWYDVDININAHHPTAEVTILEPSVLENLRDVDLPLPVTNFVTRRQLSSLPDGLICDVAGLVTFAGDIQREQAKGKPGDFWIKRWIQIRDHTSDRPIVIKLYRGVEKEKFEEAIDTGQFFVGRNMRVVHNLDQMQTSRQTRHVYLTSSRDTQIYVHEPDEDVDYPFAVTTTLRAAQQFANSTGLHLGTEGVLDQMLFSFPPQPTSFDSFTAAHQNLELTPSDGWESFVEKLSYRETTHIVVQARLVSASFHAGHESHRKSKRQLRSQKQQHVSSTSSVSGEDGAVHLGYHPSSPVPGINLEEDNFLTLEWRGLNADVILNTVKLCNLRTCPANLTLQSLLSGSYDAAPGERCADLRADVMDRLVVSRNVQSLPRYVILLDVYCVDGETALLGINRAFPVFRGR